MTKIHLTLTPAWAKANARAAEHAAKGLRARCIDHTHYAVHSATDDQEYIVTVRSVSRLDVHCTCAGWAHNRVCWHASAAVARAIRHIREVESQREQRPAPVAPERTPEQVAATAAMMRRFAAA